MCKEPLIGTGFQPLDVNKKVSIHRQQQRSWQYSVILFSSSSVYTITPAKLHFENVQGVAPCPWEQFVWECFCIENYFYIVFYLRIPQWRMHDGGRGLCRRVGGGGLSAALAPYQVTVCSNYPRDSRQKQLDSDYSIPCSVATVASSLATVELIAESFDLLLKRMIYVMIKSTYFMIWK